MNKKKDIWIGAAIVIIAAVGAYFVFRSPAGLHTGPAGSVGGSATNTQALSTRGAVPAGTAVPNKGDADIASNVAVPVVEVPANPSGSATYRTFSISANGNAFTPNTIVVKAGDTLTIEMTAVDRSYDFTQPDYGWNKVMVPKGTTKQIQFSPAGVGKFMFYCATCGGPTNGPVGYIIVTN